MGQLSSLIGFALSPVGLLALALGAIVFFQARASFWLRWFALGGLIFAASLNRYVSVWVPEPPRFFGPIDMLVLNGRPLLILVLSLLVILPVRYVRSPITLPTFALAFLSAQMVITLKVFGGGSMGFAILSAVTTGLVFFLFSQVSHRWIRDGADIDAAVVAIAVAATVFVALNTLQYALGPMPLAVEQNRFNGTTGNPQHAAAFLSVGLPALVYVILTRGALIRVGAVITAALAAYFLLWTGSRTGLLMSGVAILFLVRRSGPLALGGIIVTALVGLYFLLQRTVGDFSIERFSSLDNTRAVVWRAMWRTFNEHPLLGAPLRGDRLGFGESSWLAIGAATGLIGFIPLLVGGCALLVIAWRLLAGRAPDRRARLQGDFAGGAIISLMIGSFFEAYLLAIVSSATFLLILVGLIGSRRLTLNATSTATARPQRSGIRGAPYSASARPERAKPVT